MHPLVFIIASCLQASQAVDPEVNMTALEIMQYWGYPSELHEVTTEDGYILSLFRIPHGRFSNASIRPPILLVHGVGIGAAEFILNLPESTPAFILADAGFDVFLLNHRGTTYSRRHETMKTSDNKYWEFSIDELVKFDAPAAIDKVLEVSGANGTYWVGHSQGTAVGYMTLAERPEYNGKVKALFQLTPTGTGGYVKGVNKVILFLYKAVHPILDFCRQAFGAHEVSFNLRALFQPFVQLCKATFPTQSWTLDRKWLLGPSTRATNESRVPVYRAHAKLSTSSWNVLHWAQMASRRRVQHFDYSPAENVRRYGQITPLAYDYSFITVPVYHFWSGDDWISTREDVEQTSMRMLRREVVKGSFEIAGYNHADFALAQDCGEMVFKPIVKIVRSEEDGMCEQ